MVKQFGRDILQEVVALLSQSKGLGPQHFKSGSALAEITLALFWIV